MDGVETKIRAGTPHLASLQYAWLTICFFFHCYFRQETPLQGDCSDLVRTWQEQDKTGLAGLGACQRRVPVQMWIPNLKGG
jgi:hypothetical protein